MSFDFKRALRRATYMAMMDEEKKKKETDPLENPSKFWLEVEGLDYDELNEMDEEERNEILRENDLDPDDFFFY
ncbi:MAG: hypothetical protein Q4C91_17525 [Eubacteriales bacterium]|nr:hypothetical protein [Eubacteriales bacterium]